MPENVNVRVFLAGYMVAFRPAHVFESMGALEQALLEAATPLLYAFEKICCSLKSNGGHFSLLSADLTKDFPTMLFEYLKRFKAWKIPDEKKLVTRIKHALVALYQAEEHLPVDEPDDSKLRIEFVTQIERLRSKMIQIVGVNALNEFDEQRKNNQIPHGLPSDGMHAELPGRMTNEQLAHELLIDPTFQLDESGGCSVENPVFHRIRESFHQAFWDSLVDDLRLDTPCYVRVLRVLSEIRDSINDLAGSRETISEVIDLEFIRQQADANVYDWISCLRLIAAIVAVIMRVQSPRRDEETRTKWEPLRLAMENAVPEIQPRAFCNSLEFLLDRVNAMRIDAANARLRLIAPVIKDHGIDYERGKFQDKLRNGSLTLQRTTEWINKALQFVVATKRIDVELLVEGKPMAYNHVFCEAIRSLVLCDDPLKMIKTEICPETLLLDVSRIGILQRDFMDLTTRCTLAVVSCHAVTAAPRGQEAFERIGDLLANKTGLLIDSLDDVLTEIREILDTSSEVPQSSRGTLIAVLKSSCKRDDHVHKLM